MGLRGIHILNIPYAAKKEKAVYERLFCFEDLGRFIIFL